MNRERQANDSEVTAGLLFRGLIEENPLRTLLW